MKNIISSSRAFYAVLGLSSLAISTACAQNTPNYAPAPAGLKPLPASKGPDLTAYVNPMVGTAEHGHTYPGATVPFGMVQVSPDTRTDTWDGSSGYHYSDGSIIGFSHTHLSGTGVGGLGDILLMPTVGAVSYDRAGYSSPFSHQQETASPGYYRVVLQKPGVTAELTSTARSGLHRYTFPASNAAHVILDLQHGVGNSVIDSTLTIENSTTISGTRISSGWGGRRAAYFVLQFSKPFTSSSIQSEGAVLADGTNQGRGRAVKAALNFNTTANEQILVKVGISGTGVEGARKNLTAEIPGFDFEGTRVAAKGQWNDLLGKIQVQSKDPQVMRTFATNLYQSCISPVLFNDVDGTYRSAADDRHNVTGATFQNYTTFSLWDTFRAQHPLLTFVAPERVSDMVSSMVALGAERKRDEMPVWPLWGNETGTMIGFHSAPVIVDAYLKGFKGFDPEVAYQALKATALNRRNGQGEFNESGYVFSANAGQKQSVSRTLEFAYDNWCVAKMAEKLGHTEDAKMFMDRAANYRNVFDSQVGFMRGRKEDGTWRRPFNPKQLVWPDYTEANAWQYSWTAMQDSPGLVKSMGGDAAFVNKLDTLFNEKSDVIANIPDITGLIGQYAHGNEPVHHVAYLYNYAGAPYKTQSRVRQIMTTLYNDTPAGDPGNNDCGQMSAWYVWSAMGLYPTNPVGGIYDIGSPILDRASLRMSNGKTFTVVANNNNAQNVYVQSVSLNGRALPNTFVTQDQLMAGGTLTFQMGAKPNMKWGQSLATRPPSGMPANFQYAALPKPSDPFKMVTLPLPIRIVAGSDSAAGNFVPDENMMEGSTNSNDANVDVSAPNAGPKEMYQSERYGDDFSFKIPVPAGKSYTVRLHFAEIFSDGKGQRVENIDINGKRVLTNFDTVAEVGENKALVKEFTGIAPDAQGNIVVRIMAAPGSPDQNAKISGIEIL